MSFKSGNVNPKLLGIRIRKARERLTMSQGDLAALVSKDQAAISAYENGRRKLSAADLPLFAKALQVPLLYFYEGEINADDLDRSLLEEFHRLPTVEAKHSAIEIMRTLAQSIGLHHHE